MVAKSTPFAQDMMDLQTAIPDANQLRELAARAGELYELQQEIAQLEETLKAKKDEEKTLSRRTLPDLFDGVSLDRVGVPGLLFDLVLEPTYYGSIPAGDPEEKREEAFQLIEEYGGADLIRTKVQIDFPPSEIELAREIMARLQGMNELGGHVIRLEKQVHWATLGSWLKEMYSDEERPKIPLEPINGVVGRVCKIKPRKGAPRPQRKV